MWSANIQVSGGRDLGPLKFSEKLKVAPQVVETNSKSSQYTWAMGLLQDKKVKGCPPAYKPSPKPKAKKR